jgi:hypothetical protein
MLDNIKLIVLLAFILAAAVIAAAIGCNNIVSGFVIPGIGKMKLLAPIVVSGDNNVYVVWSSDKGTSNKNGEVMFKASTDGGKTFGNKTNLSKTPNVDSVDAQVSASGSNVYGSWWERNQTSNEPVLQVSNDDGKTFGEKIMLSAAK